MQRRVWLLMAVLASAGVLGAELRPGHHAVPQPAGPAGDAILSTAKSLTCRCSDDAVSGRENVQAASAAMLCREDLRDVSLAQVNPWMRPEVEMIVAQDSSVTGMFNWCALVEQPNNPIET